VPRGNVFGSSTSLLLLSALMLSNFGAGAATFTVANLNDSGPNSLRQAILDANRTGGSDAIAFAPGLSGTIVLTGGQIAIAGDLAINGPGANVLSVSGNNASRIFLVSTGTAVTIDGVTLKDGQPSQGIGAGIIIGGAVYNDGNLTISNSVLSGNVAGTNGFGGGVGGAIWNDSNSLTVVNCTLSGNSSGGGAALHNQIGLLTVINSRLTGNTVGGAGSGGAISNQATLQVKNSTVSGNSAYYGGGIATAGTASITNSTLSDNSALAGGGALANEGLLNVANSTLSGNHAGNSGGGVLNFAFTTNLTVNGSTLSGNSAAQGGGIYNMGALTLGNALVSGNVAPIGSEIGTMTGLSPPANLVSQGHNLVGVSAASGVQGAILGPSDIVPTVGIGSILAPLTNNGGPTLTHLPVPGSPAIDAGDNALVPPGVTGDQRGFPRIENGKVDIGAVEVGVATDIPAIDEWGLLLTGMLLSAIAWLARFRRTP